MSLYLHQETSLADLYQLGKVDQNWTLDPGAAGRVQKSYELLMGHLEVESASIYGVHTHFGHNVRTPVSSHDWQSHQSALLSYLCVGLGPSLPETVVRRALRLQAYKMSLGYSGLHPETFQKLLNLGNAASMPTVPSLGSLGASGDLIPMAHAVRSIFAAEAPRGPRDVLSLVNTNAVMASLAIENQQLLRDIQDAATDSWLLHAAGLGWSTQGFGRQPWSAGMQLSEAQERWVDRVEQKQAGMCVTPPAHAPLQERYSIRCAPQIFLDIEDNLDFLGRKIKNEALRLADNPVVLETGIWHGGLFYTAALASAAELMQNAIVRLGDLMDRQILLTVTPEMNHGLPENLGTGEPGEHVKGLHQLASALVQKLKAQSLPASLLSFSCESNNQDVVPASMTALLQVQESLVLLKDLARIHRFIGSRAQHLREGLGVPAELLLSGFPAFTL